MTWTNPKEEILQKGYRLEWIVDEKTGEEIQVAIQDEEIIEHWYFFVYIGKDKNGYRPPRGILLSEWQPEPNSWREATKEEMKIITDAIRNGNYNELEVRTVAYPIVDPKSKKIAGEIEIPESYIWYLPEHDMIIKKWKGSPEYV